MNDEPDDQDEQEELFPTEQKTVDASSVVTQRGRKSRAKLEAKDAERFWHDVFSTPVGRREMWKLLQSASTFEERFACGPNGFPQPEATWFNAGEQSLGLRMYLTWTRIDRANVLLMHDENDSRFQRRKDS
jgi:hypothetical protein